MSTKLIHARKGDKFRADQIDHSDIGKEIRIKLASGATVTDTLARFYSGIRRHEAGSSHPVSELFVGFANVFPSAEYQPGGNTFLVDPATLVTVTKLAEPRV